MPRTIVITGASDGIGAAAARQLHDAGEEVVIVGRDPRKTAAVANSIGSASFVADYGELAQVRELAASLLEAYPRIDVLANNAGSVFGSQRRTSTDGFELTFQVNHLAGFLLTSLLMDRLAESSATVIQTTSVAARRLARFDIDDLQSERRYSASTAYGNAKLANVLFTKELHRRFGDAGVHAVAFHPGIVATGFAAASGGVWKVLYHGPLAPRILTTPEQGGARLSWLALGKPGFDWQPGEYYANFRVARTHRSAEDPVLARRLWERSAEMVGLLG
ncbi:MAG: SDR family NAD(P)-dependent oxidoreductase [Microbacterium sp.]|uniref:SDR family NAD(P)-dependent oxidoreductase n=1 Tax=Microbacterium sp. TaxID=51671 RepID=UPI0039E57FEB